MADAKKSKSGGGCLGKLASLLLLLAGCGVVLALLRISQPQDLSDVGGIGPAVPGAASRDVTLVLENAVKRNIPVTLTETEINRWLKSRIEARQGGPLAAKVSLDGVCVRLEDGRAEWILERSVLGRPFTVSMFIQVVQTEGGGGVKTEVVRHGGPFHGTLPHPMIGGRFGSLPVPQGFLLLVMPSFAKLADALANERALVEEMARIRIERDRLVFDPRDPSASAMGLPQTF